MKTRMVCAFFLLFFVSLLSSGAPIRLHPKNGHYFLYRENALALIGSGEHYGAVLNAEFDYHRYLATLEADGLNYTRLFGGSYREMPGESFGIRRNTLAPAPGKFIAPWARSNTPGYAVGGNKFDLAQWDGEFFRRYRDFLSEAAKRGVVVEITLFTSQYAETQWKISPLNPANNVNGVDGIDWKKLNTLDNGNLLAIEERYTRKLVREANSFDNVIFEIENEPWSDRPERVDVINPYLDAKARNVYPNSVEVADKPSLTWQSQVKDWILSEESMLPNRHLIAQNYCNFLFPVRALLPGVDVVNFHYAYPDAVLLNYGLGKAISYDETGFIGRDDATYRRQAWNFMLSGGSVFDNLDYSFTVGHENGSDSEPNGPGGGSPSLRRQLHILAGFLASLPLLDMAPDHDTVKHVEGAYARVLSSPGREFAIYFDGQGPTDITLDLPSGQYSGAWLNTATGHTERIEPFHHSGGSKTLRTPELHDGIALRLERTPE